MNMEPFVNNRGMTYEEECEKGNLTLGNSSLPAEVLMKKKSIKFSGVPFHFTYIEAGDNIELEGQIIDLMNIKAYKFHFIGISSNGNLYDNVYFLKDGILVHKDRLFLSDTIATEPAFLDQCVLSLDYAHSVVGKNSNLKPNLWYYCIDFGEEVEFNQIQFEDNPFMHIFAMTIEEGAIVNK
ncbi:hypothetical protein [Bacillus cereus]|uniref:hypothetical protein n=1 Tax=Bacillus cereus TaxID=1396 RepID=UPI0012FC7DFC|nr:hypothetical protein [Bacillus cereus]